MRMRMLDLSHLNEEQRRAVCHGDGPLLILAGAGTGKTTVMVHHIAWLIDQGLARPEEILALTFTDKAADEMVERIERMVDMAYTDMHVSTFHAFCEWMLSNYALDIGLPDRFDVVDNHTAWMLVHDNFERFQLDYYRPVGNPYRFIRAMIAHFSRAKDEHIDPEAYMAYAQELRLNRDNVEFEEEARRVAEIADGYHTYNRLLLEHNVLDFGDLLVYGLQLLEKRPHILRELRARFKYVVVDEFQDTNWIQYEMVKKLVGDGAGLRVVADDDQSIYKFRGASVANVMQFLRDFPHASRVALVQNYRSGQNILDCAYEFIQHNNPQRLEVQEKIDKRLRAACEGESEVVARMFARQSDEDAFIAAEVMRRGASRCAVLCRTNSQVQHVVEVLEAAGISVHAHARVGLFRHPMVVDCLSWFATLIDPSDSISWYRVMNNLRMPCPAADLAALCALAAQKQWSYFETLRMVGVQQVSADGRAWIVEMLDRHASHQKLMQETSASGMAYRFFEEFGWLGYIGRMAGGSDSHRAEALVGVMQSLFEHIDSLIREGRRVYVLDFLRYVRVLADSGYEGGIGGGDAVSRDCVQVMTIHSSKGLEFDYVFIPQLVARRFPTDRRREEIPIPDALVKEELPAGDAHIEEERRLMYVACTRARRGLYLTYARDYGGKQMKKPSPFVSELPVEFEAGEPSAHDVAREEPSAVGVSAPTGFSFTSLTQFAECPLQYKFDQIIGIPTRGSGPTSFGKSVHAALERFYRTMVAMNSSQQSSLFGDGLMSGLLRVPSVDDLLVMYDACFVDDWYASARQKEEYRERGRRMLRALYERQAQWALPAYIEQHVRFGVGGAMISGVIDRVDVDGGSHVIIDYKTGSPKSEDSLDRDSRLQLLLYVMGLQATCGVRAARCEFWYLEDGSVVSFEPSDEDIEHAREDVVGRIERIRASDFAPTPSSRTCGMCKFRDMCEFRAVQR